MKGEVAGAQRREKDKGSELRKTTGTKEDDDEDEEKE